MSKKKDLRIDHNEKLPETYSKGSPADKFVCVAPKGCYHLFRYFAFGDVALRKDISTANIGIPRHFTPKTDEVMLEVDELTRKKGLPSLTLRGQEV